ncbi:MAG: TolC family protein [Pseudomonadota bacterium]|nr:TolC family protein [Pseudomonadota bacterium]
MQNKFGILFFCLTTYIYLYSAAIANSEVEKLTLKQSIRKALSQHPEMLQASRNLTLAEGTYSEQNLRWRPQINALNQQTIFAEDKASVNTSTGVSWHFPSGTKVELQNQVFFDYNYVDVDSSIFDYDNTQKYQHQTSVSIQKPLFGTETKSGYLQRKSNRIAYQQAYRQYALTVEKIIIETIQHYRSIQALVQKKSSQTRHLQMAKDRYNYLEKEVIAGKKARVSLSEAQVQILEFELDITRANHAIDKSMRAFKRHLNIQNEITLTSQEKKELEDPENINSIRETALYNNYALESHKQQIELAKEHLSIEKKQTHMSASLQARKELATKNKTQANLSITLPLDTRQQQLRVEKENLQLSIEKTHFIDSCKMVLEKIDDLYTDLIFEKNALLIQEKKYAIENTNYQNTQKKHKLGMLATLTVNEQLQHLQQSSLNLIEKTSTYHNNIDLYRKETGFLLKHYEDAIPNIVLKQLPTRKTPPTQEGLLNSDNEVLCNNLLQCKDCEKK